MTEKMQYDQLKNIIIEGLRESIETCKESKMKSCVEGLQETLKYVENDCPGEHNHYGSMYHRLPYDILKSPFGKHLNWFKKDLMETLALSIFNTGDLIEMYFIEQSKESRFSFIKHDINSKAERQLEMFNKRFAKENRSLKMSFISSQKIRAMATVWSFLNVYENCYKPIMNHFDKVFSNVHYNNFDSFSEASYLMRFNSVHLNYRKKEKRVKNDEPKPDPLISDFHFIRNSIAHSEVEFINRHTIRFTSDQNPEEYLDIHTSDFIEYPQLMCVKTWAVLFLFESMRLSAMIRCLQQMSENNISEKPVN